MTNRPIRIVMAEDQDLILGALSALLSMESDLEIVGRAGTGREALDLIDSLDPDVLISDIEMPEMSGLDVAVAIQDRKARTKTLIVTTFGRSGYLRRAMDAGVLGYLLKDAPSEQLSDAVRRVARGQKVISPELIDAAWSAADPLTDRERMVLRLAEEGQSSKEIARVLDIAPGTVRNYLSEATQKLGVSNRIEAARLARASGWL